jgi:hypothetical protein
MTFHAENTLRSARIAQVLNLSLAVPASEALSTKSLVSRQDGQILDLVVAGATTIRAVTAYK